jgi:hypothetical protein
MMNLHSVYCILLRLYPNDHQASFAAEMLAVFQQAAAERRSQGWIVFLSFVIREVIGLLTGAAAAWRSPSGPDEMLDAQRFLDQSISLTIHAIAPHDFQGARRYWRQERVARERLRLICDCKAGF